MLKHPAQHPVPGSLPDSDGFEVRRRPRSAGAQLPLFRKSGSPALHALQSLPACPRSRRRRGLGKPPHRPRYRHRRVPVKRVLQVAEPGPHRPQILGHGTKARACHRPVLKPAHEPLAAAFPAHSFGSVKLRHPGLAPQLNEPQRQRPHQLLSSAFLFSCAHVPASALWLPASDFVRACALSWLIAGVSPVDLPAPASRTAPSPRPSSAGTARAQAPSPAATHPAGPAPSRANPAGFDGAAAG